MILIQFDIGSVGIMYAYPATASSPADRSTAMAITDGAFALGIAFGPSMYLSHWLDYCSWLF
jgi:predicted MFS family arabinose efflux permease